MPEACVLVSLTLKTQKNNKQKNNIKNKQYKYIQNKMTEYLFWFVAIKHTEVEEYIKHLDKYLDPSASLIVAKEVATKVHKDTNGEHIHVAAQMDVKTYNKFHNNIHTEQMKLRKKAIKDGGGKQVGRVKDVRNDMRMLAYTVKDENIIYRNIDIKTIQEYIEVSFPKKEDWDNDLIQYIIMNQVNDLNQQELENHIIDFYIKSKTKPNLTRPKLKQTMLRYYMYHAKQIKEIRIIINSIL